MGSSFCQYLSLGKFEMINYCIVGDFFISKLHSEEENDGRILLVFS